VCSSDLGRDLNRVTRIAQVDKSRAFDDTPTIDVQTRDYSFG
jgi:hypothetical protein